MTKLNFLLPLLEFSNFSNRTNKEYSFANNVIVSGRYSNHPRLFFNKRRYSTTYDSSNNKVKLDPLFLTGFIDAEGTFIVPIRPKNEFKCGAIHIPCFAGERISE